MLTFIHFLQNMTIITFLLIFQKLFQIQCNEPKWIKFLWDHIIHVQRVAKSGWWSLISSCFFWSYRSNTWRLNWCLNAFFFNYFYWSIRICTFTKAIRFLCFYIIWFCFTCATHVVITELQPFHFSGSSSQLFLFTFLTISKHLNILFEFSILLNCF